MALPGDRGEAAPDELRIRVDGPDRSEARPFSYQPGDRQADRAQAEMNDAESCSHMGLLMMRGLAGEGTSRPASSRVVTCCLPVIQPQRAMMPASTTRMWPLTISEACEAR